MYRMYWDDDERGLQEERELSRGLPSLTELCKSKYFSNFPEKDAYKERRARKYTRKVHGINAR